MSRHESVSKAIRIIDKCFYSTGSIRGKSVLLSAKMYLQKLQEAK